MCDPSSSSGQKEGLSLVLREESNILDPQDTHQFLGQEHFYSVVETIQEAIITIDNQGRVVFANRAAEKIFGYERDEWTGLPVTAIIPEQFRESHAHAMRRAVKAKKLRTKGKIKEYLGLSKEGRPFPIELTLSDWQTEKETFFTAVIRDVSERQQTEDELRISHQEYEDLVKALPCGIYRVRTRAAGDMTVEYLSPRCGEIADVDLEALIKDASLAYERLYPEDYERFVRADETARRLTAPFCWEGRYDVRGEEHWIQLESWPDPQANGDVVWHGIVLDITDRKRTEEQIRTLSTAVEQSPSMVVITNAKGIIEYVNPRFTQMTGYTLEDARDKDLRSLSSDSISSETFLQLWVKIAAGEVWRGEFKSRKKNGEFHWEEIIISPIRNGRGRITHYVAVMDDITLRKHVEEEQYRLATTDPLTNVFNKRQLLIMGEQALREARRYRRNLSAMMIDPDQFKQVNETYGHASGDLVLQALARFLQGRVRATDILGRYGGGEFAILTPQLGLAEACQVAERLRRAIGARPFETPRAELYLTISVGVVTLDLDGDEGIEQMLERASQALFQAKEAGRDQVCFYPISESESSQNSA